MPHPSASAALAPAASESLPADASSRGGKGNRDTAARAMALVVGVLAGTFIGMGIGIGIGNAARKRMDRWSPCY
jgi:hypothetical protein